MLNSGIKKLDHILTMGQPIIDWNGIGYTNVSNNVATSSKTVCKIALIIEVSHNSGKTVNSLTFGVTNNVATTSKTMFVKTIVIRENCHVAGMNSNPPLSKVKMKRFVPICHFCNMPSHIHPKCFKYKNTFRMNRMVKSAYKRRTAHKHKIDLKIILSRKYGLKNQIWIIVLLLLL